MQRKFPLSRMITHLLFPENLISGILKTARWWKYVREGQLAIAIIMIELVSASWESHGQESHMQFSVAVCSSWKEPKDGILNVTKFEKWHKAEPRNMKQSGTRNLKPGFS